MIERVSDSLTIFVGSTFVDLELHRKAVLHALQRLETVVRGMEHFGSLPGTPTAECLRMVRGCRAYVGIFAMRYGSIDATSGTSITELEYDEAQRFHLRSLIYLIDEDRQPVLPKHVDFGKAAEKLQSLKGRLKQRHVASFFTSPDDLAMRVTQDVARLIQEDGTAIHDSALVQIAANLHPMERLDDELFSFVKAEIGNLADPIGSDVILREAVEFMLCGDNLSAAFLVVQSTSLGLLDTLRLLREINTVVGQVVLKGYRVMAREGQISPEFISVFEQYLLEHRRIPILRSRGKLPAGPQEQEAV